MTDYIEDLFRYVDTYEKKSASFETEGFLQTYSGICAVFQALREQRDKAVEVDQFFLQRIQAASLTASDLRQITLQVLVSYFESEADIDGKSNRSYAYCRGLRPVKQDVPFFETHLIPLLFREGSLSNNYRLNAFFVQEIARFINTYGHRIQSGLTPEQFMAMTDPQKILELARRRQALGADLLRDRTSLEFHLQRVGTFSKMREKGKLLEYYLTTWQYFSKSSFWSALRKFFAEAGAKFGGAFSSSRYFRLVIRQRNPAYFYYLMVIVISIFLAIYVPMQWQRYAQRKLDSLNERAGLQPNTKDK